MNDPQNAYPTAQPSPDTMGLGSTSGQRGAEILAGLRAELYPSPETLALSRFGSRVIAQIFMRLERSEAALNYVAVRPGTMTELAKRALAAVTEPPVIVDIAAGFSPRGLQLAAALPNARVIEIDLPGVVQEKQGRLKRGRYNIPPNIEWRAADLGVMPLSEVLQGEKVHVVTAEGLTAYFRRADNVRIAASIRELLRDGGVYICDIPDTTGMNVAKQATRFFSRQAGTFLGVTNGPDAMRAIMEEAGYGEIVIHRPSELAAEIGLPTPVIDFSLLVVAKQVPPASAAPASSPPTPVILDMATPPMPEAQLPPAPTPDVPLPPAPTPEAPPTPDAPPPSNPGG
jgi:O-methyltransferase involved in polyketide biosynthesis